MAYGVKQDRDLCWRVTDHRGQIIRAIRAQHIDLLSVNGNIYRTKGAALSVARALNKRGQNPSLCTECLSESACHCPPVSDNGREI